MGPISTSLMAAPTVIRGIQHLAGGSKSTGYEKQLGSLGGMLNNELNTPITERTDYKSGRRQLEEQRRLNQQSLSNMIGAGNNTHQAKLAATDQANRNMGAGLNQLLSSVNRMRGFDQMRYMNVLQAAEAAKQNRIGQYNANTQAALNPLMQAGMGLAQSEMETGKKFRIQDLFGQKAQGGISV